MARLSLTLLLALVSVSAFAADKKDYHLMKPVPSEMMREFYTERPDKTITPITVDGGHVVVESDVVNYKEDNEKDRRKLQFLTTAVRLGLTNSTEIQGVIEAYVQEVRNPDGPARQKKDGLGDVELRLKQNIKGNDDGKFAISLSPVAYIPTASADMNPHEKVEGGLAIPMGKDLGNEWTLEWMVQYDNRNEEEELDWQNNYITSISVNYPLAQKLHGYLEVWNNFKNNPEFTNETTIDLALQYDFHEDIKLDAGTFIGVSPEAEDTEFFVGTSVKF